MRGFKRTLYLGIIVGVILLSSGVLGSLDDSKSSVHTVFSVDCSPKFVWQSLGLLRSLQAVGQPGPVTGC